MEPHAGASLFLFCDERLAMAVLPSDYVKIKLREGLWVHRYFSLP
jgi:hypothetical protein